ncbi:NAD-dependent epimerase/dehydratase family protein [Aurantiacibacter sp. D1-12]|uniref:NAD-dependent epimerase/dehydratase family protein n=1 Tax=Aurantiacibacter sp. D1-12 TaxID=2993658 RepID=UPI00237C9673|nr:NAD(P)-dependent oxidoreductase [Aurantiacibacter sp. D1-12]MDE1466934.1 NAD(P)-dependent oxidoreductase [Aurantiacibacter sp. D1-12]
MIIAVTGGTGFVGQSVLEEAVRRGIAVRALTRRSQTPTDGITWVSGDLQDKAALSELVRGVDAVLHIAGVVNAPDKAGFMAGNVEGTRNVCDAARDAGVSRIAHVSSLAAREPGLSNYGYSKRMAEEVVQVSGLDWTIVRPPAVYGPRDTEIFEVFKAARWRFVPMPPSGRASIIHVTDLARLLLAVLDPASDTFGRIFEPDDGTQNGWAHTDFARAIGRSMDKNVWAPNVPSFLLRAAAKADRLLRGSKAKLTPDRASYMAHPDWVSAPERAVPKALWQPEVTAREGLAQTAKWYADNGWL